MYALNAGRLRKQIEIKGYKEFDDGLGGTVVKLGHKAFVKAEMKPVRGTEFLEYYKDANALQYKITIRFREGITAKDVLVYRSRQFEINSVININEENVALEIYCTEQLDKEVTDE